MPLECAEDLYERSDVASLIVHLAKFIHTREAISDVAWSHLFEQAGVVNTVARVIEEDVPILTVTGDLPTHPPKLVRASFSSETTETFVLVNLQVKNV